MLICRVKIKVILDQIQDKYPELWSVNMSTDILIEGISAALPQLADTPCQSPLCASLPVERHYHLLALYPVVVVSNSV